MRDEPTASPTDAVLVYRAVRAADLEAAAQAVRARGIPCLPLWRPTAVPTGKLTSGVLVHGEGELRVPRAHAAVAQEALRALEDAAQRRIREHLKDLPRPLRLAALVVGVAVAVPLVAAGAPRALLLALGAAWLLVAAFELRALARRRGAQAPGAPAAARRRGWFEREGRG